MRHHTPPLRRLAATLLAVAIALSIPLTGRRILAEDAVLAPAPPPPRVVALVGALIRTQTDAGAFVGNLILVDGKVSAVGPNVAVPADAVRVELARHVITPGLIDAHSV